MNELTPEDLGRDLAADLEFTAGFPPGECPWDDDAFAGRACVGWPAALRRALAAEADVTALKAQLAAAYDRVAAQSDLLSRRAEGSARP